MPDTLIVLPCYNERDNISHLIGEIASLPERFDILLIDDNSPDGTGKLAEDLRSLYPQLHVIHRPGKLGLGTAYLQGFRYALSQGYEYVITMDADCSHQPRYLPALRDLGREADLAIGSRYVQGGGTVGWPLSRKLISGFANRLARTVLGLSTRDCTAGYRCFRRQTLMAVEPESVLSSGYSYLIEMLYRVEKRGLVVRELPIVFVDREKGKSKISRHEIYKSLYTLLRLRFPLLPWRRIEPLSRFAGEGTAAAVAALAVLISTLWLMLRRRR